MYSPTYHEYQLNVQKSKGSNKNPRLKQESCYTWIYQELIIFISWANVSKIQATKVKHFTISVRIQKAPFQSAVFISTSTTTTVIINSHTRTIGNRQDERLTKTTQTYQISYYPCGIRQDDSPKQYPKSARGLPKQIQMTGSRTPDSNAEYVSELIKTTKEASSGSDATVITLCDQWIIQRNKGKELLTVAVEANVHHGWRRPPPLAAGLGRRRRRREMSSEVREAVEVGKSWGRSPYKAGDKP